MTGFTQESRKLTGSVQVRRGKWHIVLNLYNGEGERKPKWIPTGLPERGNKRRAEQLRDQCIEEYEANRKNPRLETSLFSEYALDWLEEKSGIEQSTWENYENVVKIHIVPYFQSKKMVIDAIRPKHIKDYYKYKLTDGRKDKKKGGLSYETLKKHASVLKLIFADAVELEEISSNPAAKVSIPKPSVEEQHSKLDDAIFLNAAEANRVLEGFDGDILQPLILTTLYYGLRRSDGQVKHALKILY